MSKIGRNEPCPCGSGKKYKKCCESLKTHDASTQDDTPDDTTSDIFPMFIAMNPRKKPRTSPTRKLRQAANNQHAGDVLAQQFMSSLIAILEASITAAIAWESQTQTDIYEDLCQTLGIDAAVVPENVARDILEPFTALRYFTYKTDAAPFFNTFIEKALKSSPDALDLYHQIRDQRFKVWQFNPTPGELFTARPAFADKNKVKSSNFDGFLCFSNPPLVSIYQFALAVRWRGYDLLLSFGSFDPFVTVIPQQIIDSSDPSADNVVPFYFNELTSLKRLADPYAEFVVRPPFGHPQFFHFSTKDEPSFIDVILNMFYFLSPPEQEIEEPVGEVSTEDDADYDEDDFYYEDYDDEDDVAFDRDLLITSLLSFESDDWKKWQTNVEGAYSESIFDLSEDFDLEEQRLHNIAPRNLVNTFMRSDTTQFHAFLEHALNQPAALLLDDTLLTTLGIDRFAPIGQLKSLLETRPSDETSNRAQQLLENYHRDTTLAWILGLNPDLSVTPSFFTMSAKSAILYDTFIRFASPQFLQRPVSELEIVPATRKRLLKSLSAYLEREPDAIRIADLPPHINDIETIPGIGDVTLQQFIDAITQFFTTWRRSAANLPKTEPLTTPEQKEAASQTKSALDDLGKLFE